MYCTYLKFHSKIIIRKKYTIELDNSQLRSIFFKVCFTVLIEVYCNMLMSGVFFKIWYTEHASAGRKERREQNRKILHVHVRYYTLRGFQKNLNPTEKNKVDVTKKAEANKRMQTWQVNSLNNKMCNYNKK